MPVTRAEARPWRSRLAAWVAVLLTIAPFARPALPDTPAPATLSAVLTSAAGGQTIGPMPRVRPAQPFDFGVVARWSWLESKPGLPPVPPAPGRPRATEWPLAAPGAIRAPADHPRTLFQPSSVGTARRPTGPPARASASA